jgi:hypothetical protein
MSVRVMSCVGDKSYKVRKGNLRRHQQVSSCGTTDRIGGNIGGSTQGAFETSSQELLPHSRVVDALFAARKRHSLLQEGVADRTLEVLWYVLHVNIQGRRRFAACALQPVHYKKMVKRKQVNTRER